MQLNTVSDRHASPRDRIVVIQLRGAGATSQQDGSERLRYAPFERVAGRLFHFALDSFERRPFTLAKLDGEELKEVPIVVRRRRTDAVRAIHQAIRDVEAHGTC